MDWNNLSKWKKNYIASTFALWSITLSVSMFFYLGTNSGTDIPPAPFVLAFIVLLVSMFIYIPVDLILSALEYKQINGRLTSSYISKKALWLVVDLIALYYFFDIFLSNKDAFIGSL